MNKVFEKMKQEANGEVSNTLQLQPVESNNIITLTGNEKEIIKMDRTGAIFINGVMTENGEKIKQALREWGQCMIDTNMI